MSPVTAATAPEMLTIKAVMILFVFIMFEFGGLYRAKILSF
ncbi:hypothetical protein PEDI_45030 [Persicobacter diffluens]|uniref:Uncharacterized protein n=1 Tax=Persicobacter diffluens TaxID=981 RepID=A0AAN4W1H8_9BACT|nr:hypothetical protein PEDI_45030 [Persicobacter diffluens]